MQTQHNQAVPATRNLASNIKAEASKNPVLFTVCEVFAHRQRTRQQITVASLQATMKKHRYNYSKEEIQRVIKIFADLGVGTIQHSSTGRVRALKNIKVTLQSLGAAAVDKGQKITAHRPRLHQVSLAMPAEAPATPAPACCKVAFTITVDGKDIVFDLPQEVPKDRLGDFIASLYSQNVEGGKNDRQAN